MAEQKNAVESEGSAAGEALAVRFATQRGGLAIDLDFTAPPGITVLFGPSGAGKSTALAAIAGLLRPTEGRVVVGTEVWLDTAQRVERPVHQRRLAYVFQGLALFPHLTAVQNVAYGLVAGDRRQRADQARALLDRMQVGHLADRRPRTFSGGEAQRVALARAFARAPRVLLLDEPFSALDRDLRAALGAEVKRYVAEARIPAVLVTHQRAEAHALGDRAVVVDRGRILGHGPVAAHIDLG